MASKVESLAFEPTPAIADSKNRDGTTDSVDRLANHAFEHLNSARRAREVRFSPPSSPQPRAKSLATTVPLLEPVSSASAMPRTLQRPQSTTQKVPQVDMKAFFQQSRALLETQRKNFEHERRSFEAERKLWDAEREALLSRIADLEMKLNKKGGGRRRYSNEHLSSSLQSLRSDLTLANNFSNTRPSQEDASTSDPPVWQTPDLGSAVTRVFSNENDTAWKPEPRLPDIPESAVTRPEANLSPHSRPGDLRHANSVSIPIEKLDNELDGINLKLTAFPPSVVAKVISPKASSPNSPPPKINAQGKTKASTELGGLRVPEEPPHLTTNAGHTPLAFEGSLETSRGTSAITTPFQDKQKQEGLQPAEALVPRKPPNERSDSYFSEVSPRKSENQDRFGAEERPGTVAVDDDPELKGPLAMESEPGEGKDNAFLRELDVRLLREAKRAVGSPSQTEESIINEERQEGADDDEGPKLKLRGTSNFGSAFGASDCGPIR